MPAPPSPSVACSRPAAARAALRRCHGSSRGVVYVAVLGAALIVSLATLAALHVARIESRGVRGVESRLRAEMAARSGIEAGLAWLAAHPDWRTTLVSGEEFPAKDWIELPGDARCRWQLSEEDGDFTDDDSETLRLRGIGRAGEAACVESVLLEPRGAALDCLGAAIYAARGVDVQDYWLRTDQLVGSGADVKTAAWPDFIDADVEAAGNFLGNISSGHRSQTGARQRRMPGASAFDYYMAVGTPIALTSLPTVSGLRTLQRTTLAPGYNPFGPANPLGIYVIDCQGVSLRIRNLRIFGTLVLRRAGADTAIRENVHWEPAAPHLPALLAEGTINLSLFDYGLSESTYGINFNPAGAPYANQSDNDARDWYPPRFKGLIYATDSVILKYDPLAYVVATGCLITNNLVVRDVLDFTYDPRHRNVPPPGFARGSQLRPIPRTWQREAYD